MKNLRWVLTGLLGVGVAGLPAWGDDWEESAKLAPADGRTEDWFGYSVALSGETALVGAYRDDDDQTSNSGSVYVFRESGGAWERVVKLLADDGGFGDHFGESVSLSGDVALIGADYDDAVGSDSGSAYVFRDSAGGWTQAAKIVPADAERFNHFGRSVSLSGDTALIGAFYDNDRGSYSGSAYIFRDSGGAWEQEAKLTASDGMVGDELGCAVALSGQTALVGAYADDEGGIDSGSAYIFGGAGSTCTGDERVSKARCVDKNGKNVVGAGGVPGDSLTVTLSTGEQKSVTIKANGKGKAKFKRLAPGPGLATARWGCGADDEEPYDCPCPPPPPSRRAEKRRDG